MYTFYISNVHNVSLPSEGTSPHLQISHVGLLVVDTINTQHKFALYQIFYKVN